MTRQALGDSLPRDPERQDTTAETRAAGWATPGAIAGALAAVKLVAHLLTLAPYGYFRDELYYLACSQHMALGYVDHPPLSIAVLRAWRTLFGDSVTAIRVVPALAGTAVLLLTARLVVELGGRGVAVLLACLGVLLAPARLGVDHYYSMNSIDALVWVLAAWLALRAAARRRATDWLALGAVLGLGVLNKWSAAWLGAGLAVALLITPARASLRSPWPWVAAALACALALPNLVWQHLHAWPTLEFMRNALADKYVRLSPGAFLVESMKLVNPATAVVWVPGLVAPFVRERLRAGRLPVIAFLTTAALVILAKGKPEYLVAAFPLALAPGAVACEAAAAAIERRWLRRATIWSVAGAMVALGAVAVPFALPVLPVERFIAYVRWLGIQPESTEKKELGALPQFYADMHGWPELVDGAARAWATLSEDERRGATIWALTGGYGPAAAIDVLGSRVGLPHAIGTHNSYWLWGWGDADGRAVVVLGGHDRLPDLFESLTLVGRIDCGHCMPYENDKPVWVGRRMKKSFGEIWPRAKRYE